MVLNCVICNSEFKRFGKQILTAKTCSAKCMGILFKAKPNTVCTCCGTDFYMKDYQKNNYKRTFGFYCSRSCFSKDKSDKFKGESNHQYGLKGNKNASFKGLEISKLNNKLIDIRVYKPDHPNSDKDGRVLKHRLLVEENYQLFDSELFECINEKLYLKSNVDVHHIDHNHSNNDISNLMPLSRSEHTRIHNLTKEIVRGELGRIKSVINL